MELDINKLEVDFQARIDAGENIEPKNDDSIPMPVFSNIKNHLVSPFIQLTDELNPSDLTDSGSSEYESD